MEYYIDKMNLGYKENWLIIGNTPKPKKGFTDRQLIKQLQYDSHNVFYVDPTTIGDIQAISSGNKLDVIYWESINGWLYWDKIKDIKCRKVNTWFDDPIMRIDLSGIRERMMEGAYCEYKPTGSSSVSSNCTLEPKYDIRVFCWDSYWSQRLYIDYGIDSEILHLAANQREYYTSTIACGNKPVFIGALHSPRKLAQIEDRLCEPFLTILKSIKESLKTNEEIPSWDKIEAHYLDILGDGDRRLYKDLCQMDKTMHSYFRQAIWGHSKNAVRVRMLREALKVSPVVMFAETEQVNHAKEGEVRAMIGDGEQRLEFHDTTGVSQEQLACLYHWGWVHLQATDPQSVYQGYPYRVFQTMASGKCLLTDVKAEMHKDFKLGEEMVGYESMDEFKEKLNDLLTNRAMAKSIGNAARQTFLENHTWEHRIKRMTKS